MTLVVVPRTEAIQAAEEALDNALVAMVGGTRPDVTTGMVYTSLFNHFDITADEVDVRRHAPEDFVARFRHRADRDRVLESRPSGQVPLVWRPWRRTSQASGGSFSFHVVMAIARVPLHARNTTVAQAILGPCCTSVELSRIRDTPADDDREFFVMAWCWHPNFIEEEKIIFIPEPRVAGVAEDERTADLGLRYLVRTRVIAYQDWSMPPGTPDDIGGDNGHGNDDDDDGHGGHHGDNNGGARDGFDEPPYPHDDIDYPYADDSDDDGSAESNHNRGHPGQDYRR